MENLDDINKEIEEAEQIYEQYKSEFSPVASLVVLKLLFAFLKASFYIDQLLSIMEEHNVKIPKETVQ